MIQARKRIMSTLDLIMTERRRCSQGNQKDFMQCLLVEDEKPGSDEAYRMTDTEIKDNVLTMIIAGQKTAIIPRFAAVPLPLNVKLFIIVCLCRSGYNCKCNHMDGQVSWRKSRCSRHPQSMQKKQYSFSHSSINGHILAIFK